MRYLFVRSLEPKFRIHFSSDMRAPYSDNHPSTLGHLNQDYWSCPLYNFRNPQHFHFSNDFPKLSQYATVVSRLPNLQNITEHSVKHSTRMYHRQRTLYQTPQFKQRSVNKYIRSNIKTKTPTAASRSHLVPRCF